MKLLTIQSKDIDKYWLNIKDLIKKCIEKRNMPYTLIDIYDMLCNKEVQLWTSIDDEECIKIICLTRILMHPEYKSCEIFLISGNDFNKYKCFLADIELWAKSVGCNNLILEGRKGWVRLLNDFEVSSYILKKDL